MRRGLRVFTSFEAFESEIGFFFSDDLLVVGSDGRRSFDLTDPTCFVDFDWATLSVLASCTFSTDREFLLLADMLGLEHDEPRGFGDVVIVLRCFASISCSRATAIDTARVDGRSFRFSATTEPSNDFSRFGTRLGTENVRLGADPDDRSCLGATSSSLESSSELELSATLLELLCFVPAVRFECGDLFSIFSLLPDFVDFSRLVRVTGGLNSSELVSSSSERVVVAFEAVGD